MNPPFRSAAGRERSLEATRLAWLWHGDQTRKGKSTCYVAHLLQVGGLVIEHGGDADQFAAGLLHDGLEDAASPLERAQREQRVLETFGPSVLQMILDCTDTTREEAGEQKGPWKQRKDRYLDQLRAADPRSLLIAACDKRHNLGDLIGDLQMEGIGTFDRFSAGAAEQRWYFESLAEIFGRPSSALPARLLREYDELVGVLGELTA